MSTEAGLCSDVAVQLRPSGVCGASEALGAVVPHPQLRKTAQAWCMVFTQHVS